MAPSKAATSARKTGHRKGTLSRRRVSEKATWDPDPFCMVDQGIHGHLTQSRSESETALTQNGLSRQPTKLLAGCL